MLIVSFPALKGGSGKSSTCLSLTAGLQKAGFNCLLVDADGQGTCTKQFSAPQTGLTIFNVLEGSATAEAAIVHASRGDIIPASYILSARDPFEYAPQDRKIYCLRDALKPLKNRYDIVLIDLPPAMNLTVMNALTASDVAVVCLTADRFSLDSLDEIRTTIDAIHQSSNPNLKTALLVTRYSSRSVLNRAALEIIQEKAENMGATMFSPVRENISVRESQMMYMSIFDYSPHSNGAADYKRFTENFIRRYTDAEKI